MRWKRDCSGRSRAIKILSSASCKLKETKAEECDDPPLRLDPFPTHHCHSISPPHLEWVLIPPTLTMDSYGHTAEILRFNSQENEVPISKDGQLWTVDIEKEKKVAIFVQKLDKF
eukprot:gene21057-7894_t